MGQPIETSDETTNEKCERCVPVLDLTVKNAQLITQSQQFFEVGQVVHCTVAPWGVDNSGSGSEYVTCNNSCSAHQVIIS